MTKFLQGFWKLFERYLVGRKSADKKAKIYEEFPLKKDTTKLEIVSKPISPIRKKREKIYIQVGLDFGTSSTKVVYSQLGQRGSYALNFNHNLPTYPNYCLPSLAAIDKNGRIVLGIEATQQLLEQEWDSGFQRLKVVVAGKYDKEFRDSKTEKRFYQYIESNKMKNILTPDKLTAIYLAYAINKTRELIENLPEYKDSELDIAFNICMPIEYFEKNKVRIAFENIFNMAEIIAINWRKKGDNFDPIMDSLEMKYWSNKLNKRVFAIPEAVAGIASYLLSLRREDGLHAIIDLGAGTTDISICNLVSLRGESESLWYSAKNIPFGTVNIERIIASHIKSYNPELICTSRDVYVVLSNLSNPIFHKSKDVNEILYKKTWDELSAIRDSEAYYHVWGSAYKHLKKQTKWEKVEIFLSGGGAFLPFAENVFSIPWWKQIEGPYTVNRLPEPEDYVPGEANAPFGRMTVAYGLSIPKPMLDRYTLPKDAPDQTPPRLKYEWIDRDEIYAK